MIDLKKRNSDCTATSEKGGHLESGKGGLFSRQVHGMTERYFFLKFDGDSRQLGHFFHFMWGYVFPSINEILKIENEAGTEISKARFIFVNYGSIMNKVLTEALDLYNISFEIIENEDSAIVKNLRTILVPKWNMWLYYLYYPDKKKSSVLLYKYHLTQLELRFRIYLQRMFDLGVKSKKLMAKTVAKRALVFLADTVSNTPRRRIFFNRRKFERSLKNAILEIKRITFENLEYNESLISSYAGCYLILRRSPPPQEDQINGLIDPSFGGTARRGLQGIEEAVKFLNNKGLPVKIFEPGQFSLKDQIAVFQNCSGIIAIRGSEFANLIWMKRRSKVILIEPSNMGDINFQKPLANLLDLEYSEIKTNEGSYPMLNPELLLKILSS